MIAGSTKKVEEKLEFQSVWRVVDHSPDPLWNSDFSWTVWKDTVLLIIHVNTVTHGLSYMLQQQLTDGLIIITYTVYMPACVFVTVSWLLLVVISEIYIVGLTHMDV